MEGTVTIPCPRGAFIGHVRHLWWPQALGLFGKGEDKYCLCNTQGIRWAFLAQFHSWDIIFSTFHLAPSLYRAERGTQRKRERGRYSSDFERCRTVGISSCPRAFLNTFFRHSLRHVLTHPFNVCRIFSQCVRWSITYFHAGYKKVVATLYM